jgi:tRNA (guanine37-N1)-methyltransferase
MHYHIITIFPELFASFLSTSLIAKAQEQWLLQFSLVNPRDFCRDVQKQVDDAMYGGGAGMLLKAQPIIDAIKSIIGDSSLSVDNSFRKRKVILPKPSTTLFTQTLAHTLAEETTDIILICGRYEGIDHRVDLRCKQVFGDDFLAVSLGQYVTMGGEVPSMLIVEAVSRLLPGVIKEADSRKFESYRPEHGGENIECPQYTRPEVVEGMSVPDVLLGGNHALIEQWRSENWDLRTEI